MPLLPDVIVIQDAPPLSALQLHPLLVVTVTVEFAALLSKLPYVGESVKEQLCPD